MTIRCQPSDPTTWFDSTLKAKCIILASYGNTSYGEAKCPKHAELEVGQKTFHHSQALSASQHHV